MSSKLGKRLGETIAEQNDMKSTMIRKDSVSTWFLIPETRIKITGIELSHATQPLGDGTSLVWNNNTYGLWNTHYWSTASLPDFGTASTTEISGEISYPGKNEVRDFLSGVGTARSAYAMLLSNGTAAYDVTKTAMPGTILGTSIIGTAFRDNTGLLLQSDFEASDFTSTGILRAVGIQTQDGQIIFHYGVPTDDLTIDDSQNYRVSYKFSIEDDSSQRSTWTDKGTAWVADWLGGTTKTAPTHIGFGTGTTLQDATHTSLEGEFVRPEIGAYSNTEQSINTWYGNLGIADGQGTAITRSGIWTDGTASGTAQLLIENKHFTINKTGLFQISFEHKNRIE